MGVVAERSDNRAMLELRLPSRDESLGVDVVGAEATFGGPEDRVPRDRVANRCRAAKQIKLRITYGGCVYGLVCVVGAWLIRSFASPCRARGVASID